MILPPMLASAPNAIGQHENLLVVSATPAWASEKLRFLAAAETWLILDATTKCQSLLELLDPEGVLNPFMNWLLLNLERDHLLLDGRH